MAQGPKKVVVALEKRLECGGIDLFFQVTSAMSAENDLTWCQVRFRLDIKNSFTERVVRHTREVLNSQSLHVSKTQGTLEHDLVGMVILG